MTTTPEPPPAPDDESGSSAAGTGAAASAGGSSGAGAGGIGASGDRAAPSAADPSSGTGFGSSGTGTAPASDPGFDSPDDRFDRRIAFGVVAALAVIGAVGPFGWHLLSNGTGSSSTSAAGSDTNTGGSGGSGSNNLAAVAPTTSSPSASPTTANPATAGASASCAAALGNASSVTNSAGNIASIGGWAIIATPSVNALRTDAATLHGIVLRQEATAVPAAAKSLCDHVGGVGHLAAMPDTVGATAWQAALSAYVAGATDSLAAATNHPAYYQAAQAQLAQAEQELDALSARIIATTQH